MSSPDATYNSQQTALIAVIDSSASRWKVVPNPQKQVPENVRNSSYEHVVLNSTVPGPVPFLMFCSVSQDSKYLYITIYSPKIAFPNRSEEEKNRLFEFRSKVNEKFDCDLYFHDLARESVEFSLIKRLEIETIAPETWSDIKRVQSTYNTVVEHVQLFTEGTDPFASSEQPGYCSNRTLLNYLHSSIRKMGFQNPQERHMNGCLGWMFGISDEEIAEDQRWAVFPVIASAFNMRVSFRLLFCMEKKAVIFKPGQCEKFLNETNITILSGAFKFSALQGHVYFEQSYSCYGLSQDQLIKYPAYITGEAIRIYHRYAPALAQIATEQITSIPHLMSRCYVEESTSKPQPFGLHSEPGEQSPNTIQFEYSLAPEEFIQEKQLFTAIRNSEKLTASCCQHYQVTESSCNVSVSLQESVPLVTAVQTEDELDYCSLITEWCEAAYAAGISFDATPFHLFAISNQQLKLTRQAFPLYRHFQLGVSEDQVAFFEKCDDELTEFLQQFFDDEFPYKVDCTELVSNIPISADPSRGEITLAGQHYLTKPIDLADVPRIRQLQVVSNPHYLQYPGMINDPADLTQMYVLLEKPNGDSLTEAAEKKDKLNPLFIVEDLVEALQSLANRNIPLRHLSDSNVFLCKEENNQHRAKLRLSLQLSEDPHEHRFWAPERVNGSDDPRSDVYSLAMLLVFYFDPEGFSRFEENRRGEGDRPQVPENLKKDYPSSVHFLQKCWDAEVSKRPNYTEVLQLARTAFGQNEVSED